MFENDWVIVPLRADGFPAIGKNAAVAGVRVRSLSHPYQVTVMDAACDWRLLAVGIQKSEAAKSYSKPSVAIRDLPGLIG